VFKHETVPENLSLGTIVLLEDLNTTASSEGLIRLAKSICTVKF